MREPRWVFRQIRNSLAQVQDATRGRSRTRLREDRLSDLNLALQTISPAFDRAESRDVSVAYRNV